MKDKFFLKPLLVAVMGVAPVLSQADVNIEACKQPVAAQTAPAPMQQNNAAMKALTPAEQAFAMKLSALHRQIFVMVFTPDLRKEAMAVMASPDSQDEDMPMSQDMAVEQVITNHRDPVQLPALPGDNSQSGMQSPQSTQQTNNSTSSSKKSYWD